MRKIGKILTITIATLLFVFYFYAAYPFWGLFFNAQRHTNPPLTPAWALECWVWDNDSNNVAMVDTLLDGYKKYDIPVRTINIDSPWAMRFNDFRIDTLRYPHPKEWFAKRKSEGYRIVMWMTTMVNSKNKGTPVPNSEDWYNEAKVELSDSTDYRFDKQKHRLTVHIDQVKDGVMKIFQAEF